MSLSLCLKRTPARFYFVPVQSLPDVTNHVVIVIRLDKKRFDAFFFLQFGELRAAFPCLVDQPLSVQRDSNIFCRLQVNGCFQLVSASSFLSSAPTRTPAAAHVRALRRAGGSLIPTHALQAPGARARRAVAIVARGIVDRVVALVVWPASRLLKARYCLTREGVQLGSGLKSGGDNSYPKPP